MATNVGIANLALQILAVSKKLEALDQDDANARDINSCFDEVRRALLRKFPWGFAKRRAILPALSDQTEWGTLNRFQLPVDYLRLLRPTDRQVDWEIEGSSSGPVIVTSDDAPLDIRYIADVTDPAQFDSEFVFVLAARIAQQCAGPITGGDKRKDADEEYATRLAEARQANAFERPADEGIPDDWFVAMGNQAFVNFNRIVG